MAGGVYVIANMATGGFYIGSSGRLPHRFAEHRCLLRMGKHGNARLQRSWDKHGPDAFVMTALNWIADPADRLAAEQTLLDRFADSPDCYNHLRTAATLAGRRYAAKRRPWSEESRARLRATIAEQMKDPEKRAARAARVRPYAGHNKGRPMTEAQKAKLSAARMGQPSPLRGVPKSPEHRAKLSAAAHHRWGRVRQSQ